MINYTNNLFDVTGVYSLLETTLTTYYGVVDEFHKIPYKQIVTYCLEKPFTGESDELRDFVDMVSKKTGIKVTCVFEYKQYDFIDRLSAVINQSFDGSPEQIIMGYMIIQYMCLSVGRFMALATRAELMRAASWTDPAKRRCEMSKLLTTDTVPVIVSEYCDRIKLEEKVDSVKRLLDTTFKSDVPASFNDALMHLLSHALICNTYTISALAGFLCVDVLGEFRYTGYSVTKSYAYVAASIVCNNDENVSLALLCVVLDYIGSKINRTYDLSLSNLKILYSLRDNGSAFDASLENEYVATVTNTILFECHLFDSVKIHVAVPRLITYGVNNPYDGTHDTWYAYVDRMYKDFGNAHYPVVHHDGYDFPELLAQLLKAYNDPVCSENIHRRTMTCIFIHWVFLSAGRMFTGTDIKRICGTMLNASAPELRQYMVEILFNNSEPVHIDREDDNLALNRVDECYGQLCSVCHAYLDKNGLRETMKTAMYDVFSTKMSINTYTISLVVMLFCCELKQRPNCSERPSVTAGDYGYEHYASTCVKMFVAEELQLPILAATLLWISASQNSQLELSMDYLRTCSNLYQYPTKEVQPPTTMQTSQFAIEQSYENKSYITLLSSMYLQLCKSYDGRVIKWLGEIGDNMYDGNPDTLNAFIDRLFLDYNIAAPKHAAFNTDTVDTLYYALSQVPKEVVPTLAAQLYWLLGNYVVSHEKRYFPYSKAYLRECVNWLRGGNPSVLACAERIPEDYKEEPLSIVWKRYKEKFNIVDDASELIRLLRICYNEQKLRDVLNSLMEK